jgi:hypothetical protein
VLVTTEIPRCFFHHKESASLQRYRQRRIAGGLKPSGQISSSFQGLLTEALAEGLAANRLDPGPHGANQINRRKRLAHELRISGQMRRLMSRDNNDIKLGELLPRKRSQFGAEH